MALVESQSCASIFHMPLAPLFLEHCHMVQKAAMQSGEAATKAQINSVDDGSASSSPQFGAFFDSQRPDNCL